MLREAYRVEVVATWGHWEAYYLATRGTPLARGWYRQNDYPQNQVLYRGDELTGPAYRGWLRTMGVRYVFLPSTRLDYSAVAEAELLRSGRSGLTELWHTRNWTLYQLPHPVAILTPPAGDHARLLRITPAAVRMWVSHAGMYTLRVHYSPYWRSPAGSCLSATADGMTAIRTSVAGPLTLHIDPSPDSLGDALWDPAARADRREAFGTDGEALANSAGATAPALGDWTRGGLHGADRRGGGGGWILVPLSAGTGRRPV